MKCIGSLALQQLWHERGRRPGETFSTGRSLGFFQDFFTSRSSWKEDVRDSLKKKQDFHHHYPAGGGVVDKNRRCVVKPDKTIIFSRSDIQRAIYIAINMKNLQSSNMLGAMPSPTAPVKQHEAFLEETKSLLHPGNFQVALIVHKLDIEMV